MMNPPSSVPAAFFTAGVPRADSAGIKIVRILKLRNSGCTCQKSQMMCVLHFFFGYKNTTCQSIFQEAVFVGLIGFA